MKIAPVKSFYPLNTVKNNHSIKETPSFKSVCPDAVLDNQWLYSIHVQNDPGFFRIKGSYTRIFRELSAEIAVSKLVNPDEKTEIKILGSSDGSEAWAYAIALKEQNAAKNAKIKGVDIANYMTETAKTGCIVMSDIEKVFADNTGTPGKDESPIKGKGFDKYLKKTNRPEAFNDILKNYPFMKYLENDPAVEKSIGDGLEWYEVNKEGLPEVTFETGDMRTSLTPDSDSDTEIYVLANSSAYVLQKNPEDFMKMFDDIKTETKDKKNVYVVLGELENTLLNSCITTLPGETKIETKQHIANTGFRNIDEIELHKLGVKNSKNAADKIFKLEK